MVSFMIYLCITRNFGFAGHNRVPFLMVVAFDRLFSSGVINIIRFSSTVASWGGCLIIIVKGETEQKQFGLPVI